MDRKSSWLLLAIMLLSAALPTLACLATARHSACCRQMMQDCGSSIAMADTCCKMRSTDTSLPPALASQPESNGLSSQIVVAAILVPAPVNGAALTPSAKTPPGEPASGRSSILRI
ncbi:MAG TPA: hypothetical protein VK574_00280 [Terracidiphilus sp.]|nr:hypothetical protein [Terracidiphilus sp.]